MNVITSIFRTAPKRLIALGGLAILGFAGWAQASPPPADTVIQNQATATYEDAQGNTYTAQSNMASITVQQVYSATLSEDHTAAYGAAGETVYFPHLLTNTGNGQDTFSISAANNNTNADSGDFVASSLKVYKDSNENGQADAGEQEVTSLTLQAGEVAYLVVAGTVPGTAGSGDTFGATLNVTSVNSAVTDQSTGKGLDGLDNTNEDTVTVTTDAVLKLSKQALYDDGGTISDLSDDTITYTVTVTNTGNRTAQNVVVMDGLPVYTMVGGGTAPMELDGSYTMLSNGLLSVNGDTLMSAATLAEANLGSGPGTDLDGDLAYTTTDEATLGFDLNSDGDTADNNVSGVYAIDAAIAPNTTVSLTFRVKFPTGLFSDGNTNNDPQALSYIDNAASVAGDVNGDNDYGDPGEKKPSNKTRVTLPQAYAVDADDTFAETGSSPGVNDGKDDDGVDGTDGGTSAAPTVGTDIQTVDAGPAGGAIKFLSNITNNGNGIDTLELEILSAGNTFPTVGSADTHFSFWDETGTVRLLDTDGDGRPDTGPMAAGASKRILVIAQLPHGVTGDNAGAGWEATLQASSAGNNSIYNPMGLKLSTITAPTVDLANNSPDDNPGVDKDAYTTGSITPTTTVNGKLGQTVTFTLTVENNADASDSFQLSVGSSWNGTTLGALADGWLVVFKDPNGNVISSTPALSPQGTANDTYTITAEVTIPSDPSLAEGQHTSDVNGDGTVSEVVDGNGDNDGDYPLIFRASSQYSGASDVKMDAVDVDAVEDLVIEPNGNGQIYPGGTKDYPHTLKNLGNTTESGIVMSATNTLVADGWTNTMLVDTSGDSVPDTTLNPGITYYYTKADGSNATRVAGGSVGAPTVQLDGGESMPLTMRVFAPANAPEGARDTMRVTATFNSGNDSIYATDQTEVIVGDLRLTKTASIDAGCDGTPDGTFAAIQATKVQPGACVVWQVVATNQGTANATNVIIYDAAPPFTSYVGGTLQSCDGDAGLDVPGSGCQTPAGGLYTHTDANDDESGVGGGSGFSAKAAADNVTFYVGSGANGTVGGSIAPGASVTVRFRTQVAQ